MNVPKFTPVLYRILTSYSHCLALTPLRQQLSRAMGTADHMRSLHDLFKFHLSSMVLRSHVLDFPRDLFAHWADLPPSMYIVDKTNHSFFLNLISFEGEPSVNFFSHSYCPFTSQRKMYMINGHKCLVNKYASWISYIFWLWFVGIHCYYRDGNDSELSMIIDLLFNEQRSQFIAVYSHSVRSSTKVYAWVGSEIVF